jgi:hypothetical protein
LVGGSSVGGGLNVRDGVRVASGVYGGIVSVAVGVAAWAMARGVFVGGAPRVGSVETGVEASRARITPSAKAARTDSKMVSRLTEQLLLLA